MRDDKLDEILSSVNTTVDFAVTSVCDNLAGIGNIIGQYEESVGKNPTDIMTFDDYYVLTDKINRVLIHSFAKVLKKSLQLCLTDSLLPDEDDDAI